MSEVSEHSARRPEIHDLDPVAGVQALGHDRAVAGFRICLDAEKARGPPLGYLCHQRLEISAIKDLPRIPLSIGGCKFDPGSFADPLTSVLGVLELPELSSRCELRMMAVADPSSRQCPLEA